MVVTGAGGQLGVALWEEFAEVSRSPARSWDVTRRLRSWSRVGLVLHAAAWTDVDGAEAPPAGSGRGQHRRDATRGRARRAARPLLDRLRLRRRASASRTSSPTRRGHFPCRDGRSSREAAAQGEGAWIARTSWLFGWTSHELRPHDVAPRRPARRGLGGRRPARPSHLCRASRRGNPELVELPPGIWHVAAGGEVHVGRLRRGDLRGGGTRLRRPADHNRRARPPRAAAGVLRAPQRAAERALASPLAGRATRVPRPSPVAARAPLRVKEWVRG